MIFISKQKPRRLRAIRGLIDLEVEKNYFFFAAFFAGFFATFFAAFFAGFFAAFLAAAIVFSPRD
jgi:polyferredoxin